MRFLGLLLFVGCLAAPGFVYGQYGKVTESVLYPYGRVVSGATIERMDPNFDVLQDFARPALTDQDGRFELKSRPGPLKLCPGKPEEFYFPPEFLRIGSTPPGECTLVIVRAEETVNVDLFLGSRAGTAKVTIRDWKKDVHEEGTELFLQNLSKDKNSRGLELKMDARQYLDPEGKIQFVGLQPGEYSLTITFKGQSLTKSFMIKEAEITQLEFSAPRAKTPVK